MSRFPAQIDNDMTLPKAIDNLSPVTGDSVNRLRAAIIAIENELGIKPSGVYSTVRGRLDALETAVNNLTEFSLAGDLGGIPSSPLVIGMQGRPISNQLPLLNQVLTWNGSVWLPATQDTVILDVLPTSVLLPAEVHFLSGDGYSNSTSPTRVGARIVDLNLFPHVYTDGRLRTMTFKADLEVSNTLTDGYIQLKDITHNAVIFNSTLHTQSISSVELSAVIESGIIDGYMREDCCDLTMYEAQIYLLNGGFSDQVICRNARIEFTYSSPILVTALLPLALPTDLNIVAGVELNGFTTPAGVGGRAIDMTKFPPTLVDGRVRTVKFMTDTEISAPGVDGYIQLFDTTHNVLVTGTQFHFTNTIAAELTTVLTVGTSSGNLRNDVTTRYEVRIWKVSGSPADRVICNNARIQITYA